KRRSVGTSPTLAAVIASRQSRVRSASGSGDMFMCRTVSRVNKHRAAPATRRLQPETVTPRLGQDYTQHVTKGLGFQSSAFETLSAFPITEDRPALRVRRPRWSQIPLDSNTCDLLPDCAWRNIRNSFVPGRDAKNSRRARPPE